MVTFMTRFSFCLRLPRTATVYSKLARLALVLACFVALLPAVAHAQEKAPADAVSAKEIERLVQTLENPEARDKLVRQLQTLSAAQKKQEIQETGPTSAMLTVLSKRVEAFGEQFLDATNALSDIPRLVSWVEAQATNETARMRWLEVIAKLLGILAAGLVVEKTAAVLLRRPLAAIDVEKPATPLARPRVVLTHAILELLPIGAFAATAYGTISVLHMTPDPHKAAELLVSAYLTARLAMASAYIAFLPRHRAQRLLPIGDETAHYLYIWTRRLTGVSIYGYVIITAASLLGLPKAGSAFLLKMLGLLVTAMLVVLILQNRAPVGGWIRGRGGRLGARLSRLRGRLADVWHILASLYVVMIYTIWALRIADDFEFILRASALTVAIVLTATTASSLVRRALRRGFTIGQDLRRQFPQLERRANRYLPVLHHVLRLLIGTVTTLALLQTWGVEAFEWLGSGLGKRFVSAAITIAIVTVIALILWESVNSAIERYLTQTDRNGILIERSARARTLLPLLRNALMVLLVIIVTLVILSEFGVSIAPLLAGAGVVGLAIGFGSQKLVQDLITGVFILFEDTISVGDVVRLGEHAGMVEAMNIRTLRLRDLNGNVHTIPFSAVSTIINMTKDFSFAVMDVEVARREDTDEVTEVLKTIGAEMQADPEYARIILEPLEILGVDRFAPSSVVIRTRLKTQPSKQWMVMREFNRCMKKKFDLLGIEIPYPHQTIYFGQDRDGRAPPLHMALDRKGPGRRPLGEAVPAQHGADVNLPVSERRRDEEEEEMADR